MRFYIPLLAGLLLAGCAKVYGPQRLDFVNTTRYTSSNRTGLATADTLASRLYAENSDANGASLGRIVVTVTYQPRRDPFLYPLPLSSLNRDLIDKNPEDLVFLDSTLASGTNNFSLFTTYGVRTTTGSERWTYDLSNSSNQPTASRALQLSMRRPDSLNTYHDYLLKLVIPAVGVPAGPMGITRSNSTRRFINLLSGLALPAYTVLKAGAPNPPQIAGQQIVDLIVLADGLTIATPAGANLDSTRWPTANQRKTLIYPTGRDANYFASQVADNDFTTIFNNAQASAATTPAITGKTTGPVTAGRVYSFRTNEGTITTPSYRYGLLLVVSIPSATTTTATAGLQLQVRMAKL